MTTVFKKYIMVLSKDEKDGQIMTRKQAIKRAEQIDDMLSNLKKKAKQLLNEMDVEGINYYPHFKDLNETLEDLVGFDLEDSIITAKDYEY